MFSQDGYRNLLQFSVLSFPICHFLSFFLFLFYFILFFISDCLSCALMRGHFEYLVSSNHSNLLLLVGCIACFYVLGSEPPWGYTFPCKCQSSHIRYIQILEDEWIMTGLMSVWIFNCSMRLIHEIFLVLDTLEKINSILFKFWYFSWISTFVWENSSH